MYDHPAIVRELVDRGAEVDACEDRGRTALMLSAANGHRASAAVLLSVGADAHGPRANNGWSAAMFAAANGHASCIKLLLDKAGGAVPLMRVVAGGNDALTLAQHAASATDARAEHAKVRASACICVACPLPHTARVGKARPGIALSFRGSRRECMYARLCICVTA